MSKYGATPTVVDNIRFASKKEAARYLDLKFRQKAGEISGLELQPKFALKAPQYGGGPPVPVCTYIADFRYREGPRGILVVEDVKGVRTPMYRLKRKWLKVQHGITVMEV